MGTRTIHVPHPILFAKGTALRKLEREMHSFEHSGASGVRPIILQADRVRRRIAASDSVAALVASLAYGEPRGDVWSWPVAGVTARAVRL